MCRATDEYVRQGQCADARALADRKFHHKVLEQNRRVRITTAMHIHGITRVAQVANIASILLILFASMTRRKQQVRLAC